MYTGLKRALCLFSEKCDYHIFVYMARYCHGGKWEVSFSNNRPHINT